MTIKTFTAMQEITELRYFIFKHSSSCPISASADRIISKLHEEIETPIYKLTVPQQRSLSNEIALQFSIAHESPQLLLVQDGRVTWSERHYGISRDSVRQAAEKV